MRTTLTRSIGWLALSAVTACSDRAVADDTGASGDAEDDGDSGTDVGQRPGEPGRAYSACEASPDCQPLEFCVSPQDEAGYCTEACIGDGSACPPSPGGTADPFCFDIGIPDGRPVCGLDCADGRTCPGGMRCEQVQSGLEGRSVCF